MTDDTAPDPRVLRTIEAVRAAVSELVEHDGVAAVTHQRVAERAGIGRATVYRHWPHVEDLLYMCFTSTHPLLEFGDSPTFTDGLKQALRRKADQMSRPGETATMSALVARAAHDPHVAALRDSLIALTCAGLQQRLADAVDCGELATAPNAVDLFTNVVGPMLFRSLFLGRSSSTHEIDELVDLVLQPHRPPTDARSGGTAPVRQPRRATSDR